MVGKMCGGGGSFRGGHESGKIPETIFCLSIVVSNTYCVVFLLGLGVSSSCVLYSCQFLCIVLF